MAIVIVSDKKLAYTDFMVEPLEEIGKHDISGIALVALTNEKEQLVLTGYWNMSVNDKAIAE